MCLTDGGHVRRYWLVIFATLVASCDPKLPVDSPFVMQRHRPSSLRPHIEPLPGRATVGLPCRLLPPMMEAQTGPDAVHCSPDAEGILCANAAFRNRRTFTLCQGSFGMDSWGEIAVAGLPNGDLMSFYLDTMGPKYRATCPHAEVSLDPDGWPECRIEPVDRIDLSTGKKYSDFEDTFGDPWPLPCAADAMRARRVSFPPRPRKRVPLVSDPARWNLRCPPFGVTFELLIARDGSVRCARLHEKTEAWRPGLAEEIRKNLRSWRFVPPSLDGSPLEVRWGMRENDVCGTELR
jgi:hypothetical protein